MVAVALGALAVAYGSYAASISDDARLHLAAAPNDFNALGILKEIAIGSVARRESRPLKCGPRRLCAPYIFANRERFWFLSLRRFKKLALIA